MVFVVILLFGAVALGTYFLQFHTRQVRARAAAALARRIGFTFSPSDTEGTAEMPFALFQIGRGHKAGPIISGTHDNLPLRIFDYQYFLDNGRSRDYQYFTCAILTIPAACPALRLTHDNALARLADHFDHHDVQLEYDDFNRRFRVNCEHQKFAFSLLDAQMMEWLLGNDSFLRVEIMGPWVLIARRRIKPTMWLDLGTWLTAFHQHIPAIVYSAYPTQ